jgi:hypothetical protein
MMKYNIWAEGWETTGMSGPPQHLGDAEGETFLEACRNLRAANPGLARDYRELGGIAMHWGRTLYDPRFGTEGSYK